MNKSSLIPLPVIQSWIDQHQSQWLEEFYTF